MMQIKKLLGLLAVLLALMFTSSVQSATVGLDFAGGCPEISKIDTTSTATPTLCGQNGNPDITNVAAILGVDTSLVSLVGKQDVDETSTAFSIVGIGSLSGTWNVFDTSITHLAFKSDGYFILAERQAGVTSGEWDNADWDITLVSCPDTICGVARDYTLADFTNNKGNLADLSNVTAWSVSPVPVPAAVWLFGSAMLGLVGVARRKSAA